MVRAKLQYEYRRFREEASWAEFAFWLVGWALLVYALITAKRENMHPQTLLVIQAQSVVTLLLPLFRLLPRKLFLARISYRAQTWVMLMVLAAAFVGKFLNIYTLIPRYDMYLHAFGCFFCVFAGYEVAMALKKAPNPPLRSSARFAGSGCPFSRRWRGKSLNLYVTSFLTETHRRGTLSPMSGIWKSCRPTPRATRCSTR